MNSTRRRYLRGLGGAGAGTIACLAGCTSGAPGDGSDGDDGPPGSGDGGNCQDVGGTRPEGTGGPGVTLTAVDDDPDLPVELQVDVEVVREAATPEHPPRLRTTLTNAGDDPIRVGEGRAVHFEYVADDCDALTLLPGDGEFPAEPDCWRLTERIAVTEEYQTFEIDAGESSTRPVDCYATPTDGDACLPVGEYRFETTVSVVSEDAEPQSSAQWGFSVLLE
ncbi:hypothetical protein CK500_00330 [Halorubrum salipaludis]|uniref:Uncharacterized protein n=1 Tax=Halorubrum salipaludis TaxID=2032630 RepID=A0A2A2FKR5_9EURY|nr:MULTISPECIES: hypothetical protein [Halorubrum]PAU85155.1 hypothetical protein CK500_00330 [Halorubrum salipaludis]